MTSPTLRSSTTTHKSLPQEIEGPIQAFPPELVEGILFFTGKENQLNNRLVSRHWKVLTLTANKFPMKHELKQFFRLLSDNLDRKKYPSLHAELEKIKNTFESSIDLMATPNELRQLFIETKKNIVGVLKKLLLERERHQLQTTISHQIPESLNDIFDLANFTLSQAIRTQNSDTIYLVFHHCLPLSEEDREMAIVIAAMTGQIQMLHDLLVMDLPISDITRGFAVDKAVENNHYECVRLLLENGPISDKDRGKAVSSAILRHYDLELIRLLMNGPISEYTRLVSLEYAVEHAQSKELIELLTDHATITADMRTPAVKAAIEQNKLELLPLLLTGPILFPAIQAAIEKNQSELVKSLLAHIILSDDERANALLLSSMQKNLELIRLFIPEDVIDKMSLGKTFLVQFLTHMFPKSPITRETLIGLGLSCAVISLCSLQNSI